MKEGGREGGSEREEGGIYMIMHFIDQQRHKALRCVPTTDWLLRNP